MDGRCQFVELFPDKQLNVLSFGGERADRFCFRSLQVVRQHRAQCDLPIDPRLFFQPTPATPVEHQQGAEMFVSDSLLAFVFESVVEPVISLTEVVESCRCTERPREERKYVETEPKKAQPLAPESSWQLRLTEKPVRRFNHVFPV